MLEKLVLSSLDAWSEKLASLGVVAAAAIAVLIAFWIVARVLRAVVLRLAARDSERQGIYRLLAKASYMALLVVGAVTALGTAGVDVTGVIAGLGLTGFALGFALKDLFATSLAGVIILLDRPFHAGQQVKVGDFEGIVERIDLRYTVVRAERRTFLLPNTTVLSSPVTVTSATTE